MQRELEAIMPENSERLVTIPMGTPESMLPFKLLNGVGGPDKGQRWTLGKEATLSIPVGNETETISKIIIDSTGIVISNEHPQKLIISGKGIARQEYEYTIANHKHKIVIELPLDRQDNIDVTFNMPNACLQSVVDPSNDDKRVVALLFSSADVIYTDLKVQRLTDKYNQLRNTIKKLNISYKQELEKKDAQLQEEKHKKADMTNLLMNEALAGNLINVDRLLQLDGNLKININARNEEGHTPLLQAALSENTQLVKLLLENKADLYSIDVYEHGILDHLVKHAKTEMLEFFINEMSPLSLYAPLARAWKTCQAMTPVNQLTSKMLSNNMLRCAVKQGHLEHVRSALHEYGADINYQDHSKETALHKACYFGYVEIVEFLLASGAMTHIEDQHQEKPIDVIHTGEFSHAIVNLFHYYEFLHLLQAGNKGSIKEYLIDHPNLLLGHLSSKKQKQLFTAALDLPVSNDRVEIIRMLFNVPVADDQLKKNESNLVLRQLYWDEAKDDKNETIPLHMAIYKNDFPVVKLLIKLGANKDDKANDMTGVAYARSLGHHDLADGMIAKFAKESYKRKHRCVLAAPCTMFANNTSTETVTSNLSAATKSPQV